MRRRERPCGDAKKGPGRTRAYRLSPEGLASLRATAQRNKPWTRSTGPRTRKGKARSKLNARKHGWRSAKARANIRALTAAIRVIREVLGTPLSWTPTEAPLRQRRR